MEAIASLPVGTRVRGFAGKFDFQALAVWLLGFGLIVYLALNGGGYDPVIRNQLGLAIWWGLLLGLAVGALPLTRLRHGSLVAVGLLAAYVGWVGLSCIWTDATHRTVEDLGRVVTLLGVFSLALSVRSAHFGRRMITAIGAAIGVVAIVGLLSRLHPAWFPEAAQTVELLQANRGRLAYPVGYWNGLASLIALGLPLVLYIATRSRQILVQALAAAAIPALLLTIYLTFSRGGTLAAVLAVGLFFALSDDRLPKLATFLVGGIGGAILIAATHQRHALDSGYGNAAAHQQGNEVMVMAIIVCLAVGFLQAAFALWARHGTRPAWTRPSRRVALSTFGGVGALVLVLVIAAGASGRFSHAWHEFKGAKSVSHSSSRFESFSSNGRWPFWEATLHENATAPLIGTGSGSFESWWARHGTKGGFVQDAHSLYFETLGELGIIGLALLVAFLGWVLLAGARRYARADRGSRTLLAAVLAACMAFCVGASYDWLWKLAVVPMVFLLLASVLVGAGELPRRRSVPVAARIAGVAFSVAAMVAIAIPLASAIAIENSQADVRAGNLRAAGAEAANAVRVEPFAAGPRLQQAQILESQGDLVAAESEAAVATEREPQEWRAWLILSRIQALRGRPKASLSSYRTARSLNPRSPLFH